MVKKVLPHEDGGGDDGDDVYDGDGKDDGGDTLLVHGTRHDKEVRVHTTCKDAGFAFTFTPAELALISKSADLSST